MKKVFSYISGYVRTTDKLLWSLCLGASLYGMLVISSITYHFYDSPRLILVQSAALTIGMAVAVFLSTIDYRTMAQMWKFHAILCWLLVLGTFVLGYTRPGTDTRAWYMLPGGITFQPAEVAKISFVLTFSLHLEWVGDGINKFKNLIPLCLHAMVPVVIVHFQGDDGTGFVFIAMFVCMMLVAGLSIKNILLGLGGVMAVVPFVWIYLISDTKKNRVFSLLFPDLDPLGVGWQQYQGKLSIGSGMIWGKGLFGDRPRVIPEMQNDFIFAYIGEVLGFVGCMAVIVLLTWICIRILMNARLSKDKLGTYICTGFFGLIAVQIVLNIGMCLSVLPVVGLTLPFFSSGGSSIVTLFCGIGVILSVYSHNRPMMFSDK